MVRTHNADAAGVNVYKMRYLGVVLSGILAGMGGLIYVIPITSSILVQLLDMDS
ncbi:MAG: ABC transporter permease subunit [Streptococcus sp.]